MRTPRAPSRCCSPASRPARHGAANVVRRWAGSSPSAGSAAPIALQKPNDRYDNQGEHPHYDRAPQEADGAVEEGAFGGLADAELGARLHAVYILHRHAEAHAHRPGASRENDTGVRVEPAPRLRAPAVNRVLEVADHRESRGGEPHRGPVERVEHAVREVAEAGKVFPARGEVGGEA